MGQNHRNGGPVNKTHTDSGTDSGAGRSATRAAAEARLLRQFARTRDQDIRERLVFRFMPLARSLAMRYRRGASEPLDDLVQVANLGLLKAIDGFDPDRERPFTAYAVPTILGELRRHFRDRVWNLRLPRGLQETASDVDAAIERLGDEHGHSPTVTQVAARLSITEEQVLEALEADVARRTLSLDAPSAADDEETRAAVDTIADIEPGYDAVEAQLSANATALDEREHLILRLRFGRNLTQYEIGHHLGISQMHVSRLMRRALKKLLDAVAAGGA